MIMTDVIIPTYRPTKELPDTLDILQRQTVPVHKIIIMDSEEASFDRLFEECGYHIDESVIEVHHIKKSEFDHGGTRNQGVRYSDADIFICMTQDAVPADEHFIEALTAPLTDESVIASYARQLPKSGCSPEETFTRQFNYPDVSMVKSESDLDRLGIKTYFCSNVSCAYRRDVFDKLGGFIDRTIFNEDMVYAGKAVKAGYKIAYAADAKVYHSHDYTAKEQFRRNVDIGISQAEHPEVFAGLKSESEGKKLVLKTVKELREGGHALRVPGYLWTIVARYTGFKIGRNYRKLPKGFIKKVSMNPGYFD